MMKCRMSLILLVASYTIYPQFNEGCPVQVNPRTPIEIRYPGYNAHSTYLPGDTVSIDIWVRRACNSDHQVWVSLDSGENYNHMIAEYHCDTSSMYQELPARFEPGWNIRVPWVPTDLTDSTFRKVMFLVYCEECTHSITETNETTVINYRPASAVSRMKPIRTGSVSGRPQAYYSIRGRRVGPEHLWRSPVISPDGLHVLPFERKQ
jgi:hypothetical protein